MSSSKLLQATAPSVVSSGGGSGNIFSTAGYTLAGGYSGSSASTSSVNIQVNAGLNTSAKRSMFLEVANSEPSIQFYEHQLGGGVRATFEPDDGMSSSDLAKIMTLIVVARAMDSAGAPLEPISYIRKHNLERHFRFEAA